MALTSTILFITSRLFIGGYGVTDVVIFTIFEIALLGTILVERAILKDNYIATFRRLTILSSLSTTLWTLPLLFGSLITILLRQSPGNSLNLLFLGFFYALAFRIFFYISAFHGSILKKGLTILLQPLLMILLLTPLPTFVGTLQPLTFLGGLIVLISTVALLTLLDRTGPRPLGSPLNLSRAFITAWTEGRADAIEGLLEGKSSSYEAKTTIITFNVGRMKPTIVIPEVHPGPFHPVGGSNLPFHLQRSLMKKGLLPLILHGISTHDLDLPSKGEVERLISSLEDAKPIASGHFCTPPITAKVGKATATAISFGRMAFLTLTLSPLGMEDLPLSIREKIEALAPGLDHESIIVVDAHNSEGSAIDKGEYGDLMVATEEALRGLQTLPQNNFRVGFAHSSELNYSLREDVGPAGLSTLILDVGGRMYTIVTVDSNNAISGLREGLMRALKDSQAPLLELCTSDTHFKAGKVRSLKGYVALGEVTSVKELANIVKALIDKSIGRLGKAEYHIYRANTSLKVIGPKLLDELSKSLDQGLSLFKRGAIFIVILSLLAFILTTLA